MDLSDDFALPTKPALNTSSIRTLLLSPPSLSSHQEKLTNVLEMHDRSITDMQMLDRLAMGLVSLPAETYDAIIILSDADNSRRESQSLIDRDVLGLLVKAMKGGASLRSQDEQFGAVDGPDKTEAILAGLSYETGKGFVKPDFGLQAAIPLKFGRKKDTAHAAGGINNTSNGSVSLPLNGKRKSTDAPQALPAGVGFDDGTSHTADDESDDELIDEDTLLDDEDFNRTIKIRKFPHQYRFESALLTFWIATECKPKAKRRRACKDCTCGLAQRLEAEDKAKREKADQDLNTLKLQADDLAEVDFTVQGKVGSCGNCSLGGTYSIE